MTTADAPKSPRTWNGPAFYSRERHAAHTGQGQGWDLEWWHVRQSAYSDAPPQGAVPPDAEKHSGYIDSIGRVVCYVRRAPLSGGRCPRCID